jgi:hypothetical protein
MSSHTSLRLCLAGAVALLALIGTGRTPEAHACGCVAAPNPSVPIVQAGERIIFAVEDGVVTAHIQIQYSGDPEQFAWLVPMPSLPTLELGTDEIFQTLIQSTQPNYQLRFNSGCTSSDSGGCGSLGDAAGDAPAADEPGRGDTLVFQDAIGPFEYAVLQADDKQPMLDWLAENGFFVPAGTDAAVTPYIRPGGYFLALKLSKGQSTGDLQPIVVRYQSELPQVPIVLTSVAADPDMPVLVWVFGEHRAIPRNYFHVEINDALLDWTDGASNYFEVVSAALDEAEGHHAFVTEFAGSTERMYGILDSPGRYDNLETLRALPPDPALYLDELTLSGFEDWFSFQWPRQVIAVLDRHLPIPPEVIEAESQPGLPLDPQRFYSDFRFYLDRYPDILGTAYPDFDPAALTAELEERVVVPTLAAAALINENPYLTRLFSMLSPEEMTTDPTFSFNPDLPDVSNFHVAVATFRECTGSGPDLGGPAKLVTEQGWELYLPQGTTLYDWPEAPLPPSLRVEMLREEGSAEVVTDNSETIEQAVTEFRSEPSGSDGGGGCAIDAGPGLGNGTSRGLSALLVLFALVVLLGRRHRAGQGAGRASRN